MTRRLLVVLFVLALVAAACSSDSDDTTTTAAAGGDETTTTAAAGGDETTTTAAATDETTTTAAPMVDLAGTSVTVFSSEDGVDEATGIQRALDVFAAENGMEITHTGARDFSDQINAQAVGGNPPDIAMFPQPGKVKDFAVTGLLASARPGSRRSRQAAVAGRYARDLLG